MTLLFAFVLSSVFVIAGSFRKKNIQLEAAVITEETYDYVNEAQEAVEKKQKYSGSSR